MSPHSDPTKQPPSFFLGVDGGGTSCRVRLCDRKGTFIGEACSGPANITLGLDKSYTSILTATHSILKKNNLDGSILKTTRAGLGLAGVVGQQDIENICSFPNPFHSVCADSDAATACIGAHNGEDGGIVILGTGSQALAFYQGQRVSIGGWGFTISDHGSGAQLGLRAIRAALLAHETKHLQSPFTDLILSDFDFSPLKLFLWSKTATPADYGKFAQITAEFAQKNDTMARSLLQQSAREAGMLIKALLDLSVKRIALHGGLAAVLHPYIDTDIKKCLVQPQKDALTGAIIMAISNSCQAEAGTKSRVH